MHSFSRWAPLFISLVVTPGALLIGIMSAGAGHGNYILAKILFPYTMLSTLISDSIQLSYLFLASVQFPVYGLIISLVNRWGIALTGLGVLHAVAVGLVFALVSENFS